MNASEEMEDDAYTLAPRNSERSPNCAAAMI